MENDVEMTGWTELLHSSSKLLEQAAPSTQFPPLQRNLDQLEALSKKLKAKTLRAETPSQSIAATRLLAREGINAEQLARDLEHFKLQTTFEDVFPLEATTLEEYLQQVREMIMVSTIQEAQKDNLRSFNDYMMQVLEDDWQKEKKDFLQSLIRLPSLPRINSNLLSSGISRSGAVSSQASSPHLSSGPSIMGIMPNKPVVDKKASVYADIVKNLNAARGRGLPFKPATAFGSAYEGLGLDVSGGKSVSMQKIWHLIQMLVGENSVNLPNISRKMSMVIGARQHLEWGHEKHIMDTIHSHPAQAALGGAVGNLQKIRAFLRVRLRDHGVLDFDADDARRQPPIDTTWQQIYFCVRTGFYDEARNVAQSSRVAHQFAPQSVEIHKRVGAFAMALETINKCLSDAICAMSRGRLDGDSRASGLIHSGNDILETFKYSSDASFQEKEHVSEQQIVLRQLEAILSVHKLARAGQHVDALREISKLSFLPLNPLGPEVTTDVFRNLSPHVQACVADLLKVALSCADNVSDSDGTLRTLKSKIANLVANNMNRSWPQDLYEKVARSM